MLTITIVCAAAACASPAGTEAQDTTTSAPATSSPGTTWPYTVDDYVTEVAGQPSGLTDVMTASEAECFATTMIEGIGIERLAEAEVTPADLAASDDVDELVGYEEGRRIVGDAMADCVDFHELVFSQSDVPAAFAACLREKVSERDLVEVLLGTTEGEFQPTPAADAAWERATTACPEAMAELGN